MTHIFQLKCIFLLYELYKVGKTSWHQLSVIVCVKKHNQMIHENFSPQTNQDSTIIFTWESSKMFNIISNILAFLTMSHLQAELEIIGFSCMLFLYVLQFHDGIFNLRKFACHVSIYHCFHAFSFRFTFRSQMFHLH